jgi:hypothetical protein
MTWKDVRLECRIEPDDVHNGPVEPVDKLNVTAPVGDCGNDLALFIFRFMRKSF